MITAIELTNFKGAGDTVRIPIKPITLLFGANSAGKSTILHALHLAYEVLVNRNFDPDITEKGGDGINLGGFRNFVHNRELSRRLTLGFELDLSGTDLHIYDQLNRSDLELRTHGVPEGWDISDHVNTAKVEITLAWSELKNCVQPILYRVSLNGVRAAELFQPSDSKQGTFIDYNVDHPIIELIFGEGVASSFHPWEELPIAELTTVLPNWGHKLEYVEVGDIEYLEHGDLIASQVLVGVGEVLVDYLKKMRHIGPIREIIPRNFEGLSSLPENRWFNGLAAWDNLLKQGDGDLIRKVSAWLFDKNKLNTGYGVEIKKIFQTVSSDPTDEGIAVRHHDSGRSELEAPIHQSYARLVNPDTERKFTLQDVGVGMSQLIPVVVGALMRSTKILAVEQPELHIHPQVQTGLGDLFAAQATERDCLFLIETHSEHLILRLLRRIREAYEGELPDTAPNLCHGDVAILFFESENDEMKVTEIGIDETGEFTKRWPRGFFEERVGEVF